MVDADLDLTYYSDSHKAKNRKGTTALVNKYNSLPSDYKPANLVSVGRTQLRSEAAKAFTKMQKAAKNNGTGFIAQSGYRSYSTQSQLYNGYKSSDPGGVDTYSARPGYSEHQTGLAIDVNVSIGNLNNFTGTAASRWVAKNAYKYGYIVRYTEANKKWTGYMAESWHLRYIGTEHAAKMKSTAARCYEEYWVKYISHVEPGTVVDTVKQGGLIYDIRTVGNEGKSFEAVVTGKYKMNEDNYYRTVPATIKKKIAGKNRKLKVVAVSGISGLEYVDANNAQDEASWDLPDQPIRYKGLLLLTGEKGEISVIGAYENGEATRIVPETALGRRVVSVSGLENYMDPVPNPSSGI
jgi:LAS superfamily LD-carboxypeptidase LdcB